ncbi:gamma-glutamyltransferase [Cupriavidus sp. PET2-C1]
MVSFSSKQKLHCSTDWTRKVGQLRNPFQAGSTSLVDATCALLSHTEELVTDIRAGGVANVERLSPAKPIEPRDTTQVCVIDADGSAVSLTHSLGTSSGIITFGLGILYNGLLSGFDPRPGRAASIGPGKRRTSSQCTTLIFKDDAVWMALGAPGGTAIPSALTQTIVNVVDFGMSMYEAVAAPRISVTSNVIEVSNRIPRFVTKSLEDICVSAGGESTLSETFACALSNSSGGLSLTGVLDPSLLTK